MLASNLFEFGQDVASPLPAPVPGCATGGADVAKPQCWLNSSVVLASQLADAVLPGPIKTWQNAILLDPGVSSYRRFLVEQAQRHSSLLGRSFKGIVIDRTDHTTLYSHARDDNLTWCGHPCASMLQAWLATAADVGAVIHADQTSIGFEQRPLMLINYNGGTRAELLRDADGIFSESGDQILNSIGLSSIGMPAVAWTYPSTHRSLDNTQQGGQGGSIIDDAYMQRHMRMGVAPMAPVYAADHSLGDSDARIDQLYRDYQPLFTSLRSTEWYLDRSAVISLSPGPAEGGPLHNVFESATPRSSTAPFFVVLALAEESVDSVLVTLLLPIPGPAGCEVHLPGLGAERATVVGSKQHQAEGIVELRLTARLWKGCALLACGPE